MIQSLWWITGFYCWPLFLTFPWLHRSTVQSVTAFWVICHLRSLKLLLFTEVFFKWSLYCRTINEFQPKSDLGHWMESTLGIQRTVYSAVHQYSTLVDVHRLPVLPLYLGKTTSILPVLHILYRSFSWNLICCLLFCYCCFWLVCLFFPPQKRKEQLPHFQSIKIPIPPCMVNIQLYLALLFLNLMI